MNQRTSAAALAMSLALWSCASASAAGHEADGTIVQQPAVVTLPAWESVERLDRSTERAEYDALRADTEYRLERFTYRSDGLEVSAYLYRPAEAPAALRPLIVFLRGSYVVEGQAPHLAATFHRLAEAGFAVLAPMFRGSDGMTGHDEMGGADLHDIGNAVTAAAALHAADTEALFLYGESRGGIMTLLAIRAGLKARAAATFGAITDLDEYLSSDERAAALGPQIWSDFQTNRAAIVAARSARRWPEALTVPLLLMHGTDDTGVPVTHTLELARALSKQGARYAVRIFDDDGHTLFRNRVERDRTAAAFFAQFR